MLTSFYGEYIDFAKVSYVGEIRPVDSSVDLRSIFENEPCIFYYIVDGHKMYFMGSLEKLRTVKKQFREHCNIV